MRVRPVPQGVTQAFGVPNSAYRLGYHPGTDYGAPAGTTAVACESGRLHWIGNLGDGYGNQAKLYLDSGGVLVYCHLTDLPNGCLVAQDQQVSTGQPILKTGATGWVDGAHLHIEWRPEDNINNPQNFEAWQAQGGGEMADRNQVNNLYQFGFHREGDPGGLANYAGRDANAIVADMLTSDEYRELDNFIKTAQQSITNMQAQINSLSERPSKEDYARVQTQLNETITQLDTAQKALKAEQSKPAPVVPVIDEKAIVEGFFKKLWKKLFN